MKTLCLLLMCLFVLVACDSSAEVTPTATDVPPSATPEPSATATTEATPTEVEMTQVPTFQPTEQLMIPDELDRSLDDTAEMQEQRDILVDQYVPLLASEPVVLDALRAVPRHSFVPTEILHEAYSDRPLPIGYGQTISQPSLVAMMTELLELDPDDKVLEIGTGSGYQAAILAELTRNVYSVEIVPELAGIARTIHDELGYDYIQIDRRDGYFGWEEHAPYDAIIVTAAPDHLPQPLVRQLNPDGGRMVIPIGPVGNVQVLWLVTRDGEDVNMERMLDVRFVPFTREDE